MVQTDRLAVETPVFIFLELQIRFTNLKRPSVFSRNFEFVCHYFDVCFFLTEVSFSKVVFHRAVMAKII